MSSGINYPYDEMMRTADLVMEALEPYCERIEIAGSLRRQCGHIRDIELVAISKPSQQKDLFDNLVSTGPMVVEKLPSAMPFGYHRVKGGDVLGRNSLRYVQLLMAVDIFDGPARAINLDLFLVQPPAQWGAIYAIRTGNADFSRWLVTGRRFSGACPTGLCMMDGGLRRVRSDYELIETPEEEDLFRALGVNWVAPEERNGEFHQFRKFLGTRGRVTLLSEEPSDVYGELIRREWETMAAKDRLPH